MKLMIIRHGDPDYENDTLTERGEKEALLLAPRIARYKAEHGIGAVYVSCLGRAVKTAQLGLSQTDLEPSAILEWLREFTGRCAKPNLGGKQGLCWDWLPEDWTADGRYYDRKLWSETKIMADPEATAVPQYSYVVGEFDKLLASHGYVRKENPTEGFYYEVQKPNNDTLVFFCHFGVESVLLSRLLGISPMVLWHATAAAPTSVTMVATEERRKGIASWRMLSYGDISHLYAGGEEPSFSARFCECYDNIDERHD